MPTTSDFVLRGTAQFKKRVEQSGLKLDSAGTAALEQVLRRALAGAKPTNEPFAMARVAQFAGSIDTVAAAAAGAAMREGVMWVGPHHVEDAATLALRWGIWPFSRGR